MNCPHCNSPLPSEASYCSRCGLGIPGRNESTECAYAAFISYRHLPRDTEVAQQVQKAIETYRLPRGIVLKQQDDLVTSVGRRLGKCFRDEDELAASHSLPESIKRALAQSRSLIVICSPRTHESIWVQREIEMFATFHGRERIICVLADGDTASSIPLRLKTRLQPDADGIMREMPAEPLAADLRPDSKPKHNAELLRTIAAIIGCSYDDLCRREQSRRRKRLVIGFLSTVALAGLLCALVLQICVAQNNAKEAESLALAAQSQEQLARGERMQAIETALSALPSSGSSADRPLVPAAQQALEDALTIYPDPYNKWRPLCTIDTTNPIKQFAVSPAGTWVATLDEAGAVITFDGKTGRLLHTIDLRDFSSDPTNFNVEEWTIVGAGLDTFLMACCTDNGGIVSVNALEGTILWEEKGACATSIAVSEDGYYCAIFTITPDGTILIGIVDVETGEAVGWGETEKLGYRRGKSFLPSCFSIESGIAALCADTSVLCFNLNNDDYTFASLGTNHVWSLLAGGGFLAAASIDLPENSGGLGLIYEFGACALPADSGDPLWHIDGTYDITSSGPPEDVVSYHGAPRVQCFTQATDLAVACTAGQSLNVLSCDGGKELYHEEFSGSVVEVTSYYHSGCEPKDRDTLILVTSDGMLNMRAIGTAEAVIDGWDRQLPNRIDSAGFALGAEGGMIAYAHASDQTTRILAYQYANDSEDDERTLSLDELIARAHEVLEDS
ncbi:TIR domain-containing protein [Adlercreutzia sp. R21]|uniref:TIR domain-containing protein n=1 Tax=Adlercreutzia wanghongyangiae TaxID=3111451 RepID=A0ABU6IF73_9ACTN|nr:TIR domain-containing protein [Adlercreutzia sp. R21]MEC4175041.1 TIR domain-containing protein [Adlercreutzia sp. R7]MEC4184215.1 TIR domain-containing protein [Adlercreutzia sp. R21]